MAGAGSDKVSAAAGQGPAAYGQRGDVRGADKGEPLWLVGTFRNEPLGIKFVILDIPVSWSLDYVPS